MTEKYRCPKCDKTKQEILRRLKVCKNLGDSLDRYYNGIEDTLEKLLEFIEKLEH